MQSRIFEIFAQVEDHLTKAQGGLGIGLALAKQLVSLHGGTLGVASAGQDQGSVFTVRVPIAVEDALIVCRNSHSPVTRSGVTSIII
jgi:signal transduction histidine kinase